MMAIDAKRSIEHLDMLHLRCVLKLSYRWATLASQTNRRPLSNPAYGLGGRRRLNDYGFIPGGGTGVMGLLLLPELATTTPFTSPAVAAPAATNAVFVGLQNPTVVATLALMVTEALVPSTLATIEA